MFRHQQTSSRPASTVGLARELTMAVLSAEGVATPGPFHLKNTASFIHRMNPHAVHTAAIDSARTVRVQVIKPPAALNHEDQKQLVKEVTETVAILGPLTLGFRHGLSWLTAYSASYDKQAQQSLA